jgi:hypothetical protein
LTGLIKLRSDASDVDCARGTGSSPEYLDGPVSVVGNDTYERDRDSEIELDVGKVVKPVSK